MSRAEELLDSLDESGISVHLADPYTEPHIVVDSDRYITVPDELKRLAVQYDHNIETVTFDCPRYWDGFDMSEMTVYINYLRSDKETGAYKATNVIADTDDPSIMHFDWTISRNVTEAFGQIVFLVCVKKTDADGNEKNHWNSELCKSCSVSEGLEIDGEALRELYPDIIEQWYQEVTNLEQELIDMRDSGEFDGATFTPFVSEDCDLSWSNDRGRENPPTVNIRGMSPTIHVTDISGGHRLTITDINGTQTIDVMNTIIESTEAVTELMDEYVYVGEVEPASGPKLWFDTAQQTVTQIILPESETESF